MGIIIAIRLTPAKENLSVVLQVIYQYFSWKHRSSFAENLSACFQKTFKYFAEHISVVLQNTSQYFLGIISRYFCISSSSIFKYSLSIFSEDLSVYLQTTFM